jgi:hypothetical protein
VFYFPGCGSERLFSQVGLATQAMLWEVGVQTVLPPGYLCCGYPQRGAGEYDKAEKMMTDNRVLFHRMANTLNYLDIKTVLVSCGTCYDQLATYEFEKIFPGCRIMDIHEYLLEKGVKAGRRDRHALHVPRALPHADEAAGSDEDRERAGRDARQRQDREERPLLRRVGHLAVIARPDISTQVRFRKEEEDGEGRGQAARRRLRRRRQDPDQLPVLPAGPVALQRRRRHHRRLHRGRDRRHLLGENWMPDYVKRANDGGIERVLV